MNLNDWFHRGMTTKEYINSLTDYKDHFLHIYNHFTPFGSDSFFNTVKHKQLRVIAISEVWCGHCMLNIPILLRFAEKVKMDIRILKRDDNLQLMDQYLTNGKRIIPIFIFIDEQGQEVAQWGPVAPSTKQHVALYEKQLPPKDDPHYKEAFKQFIKDVTQAFREDVNIWNGTYESMKRTVERIK